MPHTALDAADAALLRQLSERASLDADEPAGAEVDLIRSADTAALRRLLANPHPGLTPGAIVRVWRELHGRAPASLTVWPGRDPVPVIDHTRLQFGSVVDIVLAADPEAALAAAAQPGAAAVLALDSDRPWWGRLLAQPAVKVFAALPCLASHGDTTSLAVGLTAPEPTGRDQTFWVTDAPGSVATIVGALGADGVAAEPLASAGGLKLLTLAGFYQASDPRLARAPGRLSGVIGAASTPLDV